MTISSTVFTVIHSQIYKPTSTITKTNTLKVAKKDLQGIPHCTLVLGK